MSDGMNIEWQGVDDMVNRLKSLEGRTMQSLRGVAQYYGPKMESHAKESAPWVDRTGAARMSLHWHISEEKSKILLHLSHGVQYGVYLETAYAGKNGVLWGTIQRHLPGIQQSLREIFR
jgi:hypothetical protein